MKEAMLYEKMEEGKVRCNVCGRRCLIPKGKLGVCGVRKNLRGKLYSIVYGKCAATAIDPIEKKPFFHFAPGTRSLSVATVGCNFKCKFCQNWDISQEWKKVKEEELSPDDLVSIAKADRCEGIAYTYTEPTIFLEYAYETMVKAETKLYNVFVTNGYMTPETVNTIGPHLDAANVDYKGSDDFYREIVGIPSTDPIRIALKELKKHKVWIEITNLIIPDYNDDEYHIEKMVKWVKKNLGPEVPIHFSRFFPNFKMMDVEPTPIETVEKAVKIAKNLGMYYVYAGNVWGHKYESTYCYDCGELLIKREGFKILEFNLDRDLRCPNCGAEIHIKGKGWIPEKFFR